MMAYVPTHVLRITSVSEYLGGEALNVWWYQVHGDCPNDLTDEQFKLAFEQQVLDPIAAIQVDDVIYQKLIIEDLSADTDPVELSLDFTGGVTSEPQPGFMAYEVKLLRSNKDTRHGRKSFVGVTESAVVNGTLSLSAEQKASMELACSTLLRKVDLVDNPFIALPIICGRQKVTVDGKSYYVPDLTKRNPVRGAVVQRVSTQNSRKVGRGS